jgi:hypothetical protein
LVRDPVSVLDAPWPDTLLVRLFDEAADEEIALERGELDAAVFWPGEVSSHLREQPLWRDYLSGTMKRGVVAATWKAADAARDSSDSLSFASDSLLASLNREIFAGDLEPLREGGQSILPSRSGSLRFEVDPSLPGRQLLERFLNRGRKPHSARDSAAVVQVRILDLPIASTWAPGTAPLFAIRCPLVSATQLQPYLAALGPDLLVGMIECRPATPRP